MILIFINKLRHRAKISIHKRRFSAASPLRTKSVLFNAYCMMHLQFLPRDCMQYNARYFCRNSVRPFVCLSVTRMDCDKNEWCIVDILIPHEKKTSTLLF